MSFMLISEYVSVVIAMSGGVDSSVAALKLSEKVAICLWNSKKTRLKDHTGL